MFASLRVRNYRLFASGQVVSLVGTWMQRVAQDWLVLQLSGGNALALGVAAALQFAPTLLLSLWAGVLADRYDKRRLLIVIQAGMGLSGLVLGLLDVAGTVQLWHVYALCVALGVFSALDTPVRQAFAQEMVGPDQLANAVALNAMTFNVARIVGPAVAGVAITMVGTGWVFLINAATFVGVLTGLFRMDPARLFRGQPAPRRRGQIREALRYVRARPDLVVVMTLVGLVSTFGLNFQTTLAYVASDVFQRDADGYGLLSTMLAVGTLTGATLAARRSTRGRPRMRLLIGGALAFGLLEAAAGVMPSYLAFAALLVPTGAATLTFTTTANATVQLSTDAAMRGRVMGLYLLIFIGCTPVGGPLMGWVGDHYGGRAPLVLGGLLSALSALACGIVLARRGGFRLRLRRWSDFRVVRRP
ncbi:putative arabinose efflux permease, MFS family [Streptoalloteichus tenebrarius]|uniref:Arabinose efflux permease, MFS family n=1 Tax=Streptoalloteichus tenebrarius (strain ATCC 17920 / DSM 40477 / JCM 4838 / CBS 697.72 / NBRC 16177 / NCIMB 11028 / NRRL B-12390 / A12253. 1 / ISP 5477) TaxID=1933 RepID=A0ABT1HVH3_STRSD|nr:MFS transporter [Streptoalloteichus tenebrarius]MCP2259530.1 putative arabinose efflux permease, MFS family [Streptoalloteichus tenebrarius]BFF01388.1 MFS transporter [Streptoalloteichus tenebrarius]